MTTDSEQRAQELLKRNGRVEEPNNIRLTAVRPDSPDDTPQLDYVSDENPLEVHDSSRDRVGHNFFNSERLTVGTTAIELTHTKRAGATHAEITVETAVIRTRVTGESPTSSVGKVFEVGDLIRLQNEQEIADFRAIRRDGTSATIDVEYGY